MSSQQNWFNYLWKIYWLTKYVYKYSINQILYCLVIKFEHSVIDIIIWIKYTYRVPYAKFINVKQIFIGVENSLLHIIYRNLSNFSLIYCISTFKQWVGVLPLSEPFTKRFNCFIYDRARLYIKKNICVIKSHCEKRPICENFIVISRKRKNRSVRINSFNR